MTERKKYFKNQKSFYNDKVRAEKERVTHFQKKGKMWAWIRLVTFSIIPLTIYFLYEIGAILFLIVLIELLLFVLFVRKSAENKEQLNYHKNRLLINENELKALDDDYSSFSDGEEYIDPKHRFSYDLDLFGKKSFFQFINRTTTKKGEQLLAKNLLNGVENVAQNNEAVEELAKNIEWTQKFRASSRLEKEQLDAQALNLYDWTKKKVSAPKWSLIYSWIAPFIAVALTFVFSIDLISGIQFVIFAAVLLAPISRLLGTTNQTHKELTQIQATLKSMERQFGVFQELKPKSELLKYYDKKLFNEAKNGYDALKKLNKIVERFENRNNVLVALLLNFYLAWDFRLINSLKKWKKEYKDDLPAWETIIYELEYLISGATLRFNQEEFTIYGELTSSSSAEISIKEMGHPLIKAEKRVNNDYITQEKHQFAIITGPNMAGKSTFLRSLGLNLMLAQAGFSVFAESFTFPDLKLYSSMRTTDDLSDESSYFHAELIRLRFIMDAIERGENIFIILDEILKGTNSKDKEKGSTQFLEKLVGINAKGIIATHDLKLTELAEQKEAIFNLYFDTTIEGDEIDFDYKLRAGVAKNMNASFLLEKMKLV